MKKIDGAAMNALRKDAERYRWLRDQIKIGPLVIAKVGMFDLVSWSGDDPDSAIDAAMDAQQSRNRDSA